MGWRLAHETDTTVTVWDDDTRRVTGWDRGAPDVLTLDRAYDAQENADADARAAAAAAAATAAANDSDIGDKITTVDMPAMQAILDATNSTINGSPASSIKDLAKAVRRLDRKIQRLLDGTT